MVMKIPYFPMYQQHRGHPPLDPRIIIEIQHRLGEAEMRLKQGIDYDWKQCVVRYPEVLAHYYTLIKIPLPNAPESPFGQALAGGGQTRPPSVVNPPPPPQSMIGMGINRSATAPPKKSKESKRSSKVNMERELNPDVMAMLSHQLEGLARPSNGSRTKSATPAPQATGRAPPALRPNNKRRESKDFAMGMGGLPRQLNAPPHVPQPPGHSLRGSHYDFAG